MKEIEIYEDFIEGNLNIESEKKFMARLTLDDELRTNFRHYLVVTNSIRNFVENERLPADVENSVYKAIGISPIMPEFSKSEHSLILFFKGKFFTAIISSILTFTLAFFLFKSGNSNLVNKTEKFTAFSTKEEIPLVKIDKNIDKKANLSNIKKKEYHHSYNNVKIPDDWRRVLTLLQYR